MIKRLVLVVAALLVIWVGIRLVFAVRIDEPGYRLVAGKDVIRQEWSYCTRFANVVDPKKINVLTRSWNRLNLACFRMSYPLFWLQDRTLGTTTGKGDTGYDTYMAQVSKITAVNANWDYVTASSRDGRGMAVFRNGRIVQKID